jgi:ribose 5-phosphate isomerase B
MSIIAIASDHGGFTLKHEIGKFLEEQGHEVRDLGTGSADSVDYPDFAHRLAEGVSAGTCERGILVCGTGIGMSMVANRHRGVRAALCTNEYMAAMARRHNDANVLCLGERVIGTGLARGIVTVFLATGFDGGRHRKRVDKFDP